MMKAILISLGMTALALSPAPAAPKQWKARVDWKLFGGTIQDGHLDAFCFYDEKTLQRPSKTTFRVWSKCLLKRDLDAVDNSKSYYRGMIDLSVSRKIHGYRPPWVTIHPLAPEAALTVMMYEAVADVGDLDAHGSTFFLEFDCVQRRMRLLGIGNPQTDAADQLPWSFVSPEGNGATLLELLCPS